MGTVRTLPTSTAGVRLAVGDFMSSVIDEGGYGRFGAYSRVRVGTVLPPGRRGRRLIRTVPMDPPPALPQINSGVGQTRRVVAPGRLGRYRR